MATLAEIKKQYPQYANVPDKELADALYDQFYKGKVSKGDFYGAVGYKESWKEALGRGGQNLAQEFANPVKGAENLVLGLGKGALDLVDGGAQLLTRGLAGATNMVAPDSALNKFMQSERQRVENINQKREDQYQKLTQDSVLAGVGRVGGNAALPIGQSSQVVNAASLPAKMLQGSKIGATNAALQPVYDMDQGDKSFVLNKAGQLALGTGAGAAVPVVSRVVREGAAKLGSEAAENSLVKERMNYLFRDNPNALTDANIIKDLANVKGAQGRLAAQNMNAMRDLTLGEAKELLERSGKMTPDMARYLDKYAGLDAAKINALRSTPEGNAIADVIENAIRIDDLTQTKFATGGLRKLGRIGVDMGLLDAGSPIPLPTQAREGIKNFLGGTQYRHQVAENLTGPRNVKAAERFLQEAEGALTPGQQGMGVLRGMASAADAEKAAMEAEKAANAARTAKVVDPNKAISDLQATDPTYILGLNSPFGPPRNPTQMSEFSKVIRYQMEDAAKKEAEKSAGVLSGVKEKMGVTNRSGALRNLEDGFGLSSSEIDDVLKGMAKEFPEMSDIVGSLYKSGTRLSNQDLFDLSDMIAARTGKRFGGSQGILNQTQGTSAVTDILRDNSGAPVRSQNLYKAGAERKIANYAKDRAMIAGDQNIPDNVKQSLNSLYDILENTGDAARRSQAIDAVIKMHPEFADFIGGLMGKY